MRNGKQVVCTAVVCIGLSLAGCSFINEDAGSTAESAPPADVVYVETESGEPSGGAELPETDGTAETSAAEGQQEAPENAEEASEEEPAIVITAEPLPVQKEDEEIAFDPSWQWGEFSKINSGKAILHYAAPEKAKDITVCINAGHGTSGGTSVKTQCHPDGTPKVTGGTTDAGETYAVAVSTGMDFLDGTPEREATLALSLIVRDRLLENGYNVLMIREGEDIQLDNIARTLIANHYADCHIAIHYDSTDYDKGAYYMAVPQVSSYLSMEPVASHWQEHDRLGDSLIAGLREAGVKVMGEGAIEMDLTQTSYSEVPSIDLECVDKASDRSAETLDLLADGILKGLDLFFAEPAAKDEAVPEGTGAEASGESEDTRAG